MLTGETTQSLVETGKRCDGAHVSGGSFGDDARDGAGIGREGRGHRVEIVVAHDDGVFGLSAGHAGRGRQPERREAGSGVGEKGVDVAVIATGELDDLGASGESAGEADCAHRGFGSGVDQANLFHGRDAGDDFLGEGNFAFGRRTEGETSEGCFANGFDDCRVSVPENHRTPGRHQVDVIVSVDVGEGVSGCFANESRCSADRTERADGRVDATRNHVAGTFEEPSGVRCMHVGITGRHSHGFQCPQFCRI